MTAAQTPANGAKAPDFTLQTPTGKTVYLAKERSKGTTTLVVLRGDQPLPWRSNFSR